MYFRESENMAIEMSLNQGRLVQSASGSETSGVETHATAGFGFGFGFAHRRSGSARRCRFRVQLRVRRPAVQKRTPPPGLGSASGLQTGGAEAHATTGFGFAQTGS